jgi:beta-lactamase superfamily II metal-dependent hydrolase
MADAGAPIEQALLASGHDLGADVIVAGRHDRDRSLGDGFVRRVKPRAIIAANEPFPPEERLDPRQADYWRSLGIAVFDQLAAGGVTLRPDAERLEIRGFVDGSRVVLQR